MRHHHHDDAGFTLVEVLIALAIFGVVIAQAFAVFSAQHLTYTNTERAIEVQQDVRLVADAVLSDVRMAGYMVPQQAGIASVDGGTSAPDMVCVSDPDRMDDTEVAKATARFDRSDIDVSSPLGAGDASVTLAAPDIDGDGLNDDFAIGDGIIIVDGTSSHCGVIESIGGASNETIGFRPNTPAGFSALAGTGRVVPAIVYEVNGTDLRRNGLRLATQVEDLQVEFGVDANSDGQIVEAEYVDDLNGSDPLDILAVRVSVIARADREDESIETSGRPAAANRTAGAADGFRRRRVTAIVLPRNLL